MSDFDSHARSSCVVYDEAGNPVDVLNDGGVFRLRSETTIAPGQTVGVVASVPDVTSPYEQPLENGGSPDMAVDGSGGDVVFKATGVAGGDEIVLSELDIVMIVNGFQVDGGSFAGFSALANGVLIDGLVNAGASAISLATIKQNEEFFLLPGGFPRLDYNGVNDVLAAKFSFGGRVLLVGVTDEIRVTVRDDLTTPPLKIMFLRATLHGTRETP